MDDPPEAAQEILRGTGGHSTLQQIVRAHYDGFLAEFVDEHGGRSLPGYVIKEFQALLERGDPAFGFCRIRCPSCTTDMILPFSCKGRTFCPSCGGRQMAQSAAHLVDSVFPDVPVRQWVLSVPKLLRLAMAMDPDLCRDVTRAHLRAVSASYVRRAKAAFELEQLEALADGATLSTGTDAVRFHPGAVNATQRFGSSLELNVHFHSIYLDGVYVTRSAFDRPIFVPAGPLDADEVQRVHGDVIVRIRRVLEAYELNPSALGLPPRDGDASTLDPSTDGNYEQPLLDFGDARDGPFFPSLKSASVYYPFQIVRQTVNPRLNLLGIVLSCVNKRTRLSTELVRWVEERFAAAGEFADFKTKISRAISVAQAQNEGRTIIQAEPAHKVTEEYHQLAREVRERLRGAMVAKESPAAPQAQNPMMEKEASNG